MTEKIKYQLHKEGYGEIRLNDPDKRNAICEEMVKGFKASLEQALQDQVHFLVVTGNGDHVFCAGGDLNEFHGELTPDQAFKRLYQIKELLFELVSFPVPTICLLNGNAFGGGCEIATACDFRIAKASTKFGFVQTKLGIIPGWGGGQILYEKVHHTFAYHWLLSGEVYSAETLKNYGWLHNIIPAESWSDEDFILKPYKNKSLDQMKMLKNQYKKSVSVLGLSAKMNEEVRNCSNLWGSPEHKKNVQKFLSKNT